jgi:UMP-CMP kinase
MEVFGDNFELICTLYLTCTEEQCINRILSRSQSSGRSDDNIETLKKRFKTFYNESLPVMELLNKVGPIVEVDGTKPAEEVFENISFELNKLLQK